MGFYSGKTAIVTGAGFAALKDGSAGSIGYGIATAFAKEGANLVITGRNEKKLDAAKEKLEGAYGIEVLTAQAETKGSVVNFASGAGLFGNYGQCAYAAAKEGIRGLTRVAATEWGPDGINVNIVCPLAWTAALENFKEQYPEAYEANVHMPPMGHYGNVETEIGRAVLQLCGPDFKFMSGETITLEGGMGQRP